jgi:hypothetical protein
MPNVTQEELLEALEELVRVVIDLQRGVIWDPTDDRVKAKRDKALEVIHKAKEKKL